MIIKNNGPKESKHDDIILEWSLIEQVLVSKTTTKFTLLMKLIILAFTLASISLVLYGLVNI